MGAASNLFGVPGPGFKSRGVRGLKIFIIVNQQLNVFAVGYSAESHCRGPGYANLNQPRR